MQEAFSLIKNSTHIVFASHINPDADTMGSSLGLAYALGLKDKQFTIYNHGEIPSSLSFLPGISLVTNEFPKDADLVVSLDCGNIDRLGLPSGDYKILNIDHHASNEFYGDINIVIPRAASAASVVLDFLSTLDITPTKDAATCFYAALASDTGFFKYEATDEKVFLDAAYLVRCGANATEIAKAITMQEPLSKIRLLSHMLSTLELRAGGKMAYLYMTKEALKEAGAKTDEADGAVETARSIKGVEVSLFLREQNGAIRGSLRSKTEIDVNKVASRFGGGGHIRAAGFSVTINKDFVGAAKDIADTIELIISEELK